MNKTRRGFLQFSVLGTLAGILPKYPVFGSEKGVIGKGKEIKPIAIATWDHGVSANEAAWEILQKGGTALDAVEHGVNVVENDPNERTVGIGGFPDREGNVTLDACIMDDQHRCGSVAFLQHIKNPVSVARKVMEKTPHVMLVGSGALQFALTEGFKKENLLTADTIKEWEKMKDTEEIRKLINIENHDTIGMLVMDDDGNISGACTTSGTAFKMFGRVGDSPIIGAGLYVDNEIGAATATGWGEEVIRNVGSAMVVEMMRNGASPQEACEEIVKRIAQKNSNYKEIQVGFIALNKAGETGAFSIQKGFTYALQTGVDSIYAASASMLK